MHTAKENLQFIHTAHSSMTVTFSVGSITDTDTAFLLNSNKCPALFSLSLVLLTLECHVLNLFIRFCSSAVSSARPSHRSSLLESKASSCLFMRPNLGLSLSAHEFPLHSSPAANSGVRSTMSNSFKMHHYWSFKMFCYLMH